MTHRQTILLALALAAPLGAGPALAQDFNLRPNYGTHTLSAGFRPDPQTFSITAGGSINVASRGLGPGCVGYVSDAPDLRVNYSGGGPLDFLVVSGVDTTLVINMPDGSWLCNDDAIELHPQISLSNAPDGQYDIWVGTYGAATATSVLGISRGVQQGGGGGAPAGGDVPDISQRPTIGTRDLASGFTPDPVYIPLDSGGSVDASVLGSGCTGFITVAPAVRLNFQAGRLPLILSVDSRADTTLVVNLPDGSWLCNDDGGNGGLNPSLTMATALSGQYDIYVGTFGSPESHRATLSISELYSY